MSHLRRWRVVGNVHIYQDAAPMALGNRNRIFPIYQDAAPMALRNRNQIHSIYKAGESKLDVSDLPRCRADGAGLMFPIQGEMLWQIRTPRCMCKLCSRFSTGPI